MSQKWRIIQNDIKYTGVRQPKGHKTQSAYVFYRWRCLYPVNDSDFNIGRHTIFSGAAGRNDFSNRPGGFINPGMQFRESAFLRLSGNTFDRDEQDFRENTAHAAFDFSSLRIVHTDIVGLKLPAHLDVHGLLGFI